MAMLPPDLALSIQGLSKTYRASGKQPAKHALNDIELAVPRGSFFALLGPNGAGKSTMINILAGLVNKTAGCVEIFGIDIDRRPRLARRAIGIVPQELYLDAFFTPREALDLQAGLYGVPIKERVTDELLAAVGLADKADAYARTLSGGMRRRLLVAKALVHRPPVVVLDEPTAGVDVELRRSLWRYMRELNEQGVTIVLTTHYLEEAEQLCDRIAIVDGGRVVACDTTKGLLQRVDEKALIVRGEAPFATVPEPLDDGSAVVDGEGRLVLRYRRSAMQVEALLERIHAAGVVIVDLVTKEADLEDLFVRLTSRVPEEPAEAVS